MAALMGLPVTFVFSHDSIGIGRNGPTHQPVEILASLRAMPNMLVLRPADAAEVAECWAIALQHTAGPVSLVLARQALPRVRLAFAEDNLSLRGAYILQEAEGGARQATLLATGSEVALAVQARAALQAQGVPTAVVSMPSWELFERQPGAYQQAVLGVGTARVAVEAAGRLGDDAAMVTALRTGALDISAKSQGALAATVPEYAAFGMPFLFANLSQAWKLLDGPLGKELGEKSAEKGMVVPGYWDNGTRHMSNSKKPLLQPADLKGMKMRTPPDAVTADIMQSLGAEAQQIKFSELYVALQQGVVDGQENPLMNIWASKIYEVQKFISLTGHKYEMTPFLMSKRSWNKLSDADKKAVQEAATEATALQRKLSQDSDDKLVAELKAKGVRIDVADKAAFERATSQVDDKWMASPIGPFVKKVIAAARAK